MSAPDLTVLFLAALATEEAAGVIPEGAERPLFPWEVGTISFADIDGAQQEAYRATAKAVDSVRDATLDALTHAVSGAGDPVAVAAELNRFAQKMPESVGKSIRIATADVLDTLRWSHQAGAQQAVADAVGQGITPGGVNTTAPRKAYRAEASAAPNWVYTRIATVARDTGGPTPVDADTAVRAARDTSMDGGYDLGRQAVNVASGGGRRAAAHQLPEPEAIYASELLDGRTCRPCRRIDGKHYATEEEAERDYPTGGYSQCSGGHRCRGTLVYVWGEEERSTDQRTPAPQQGPEPVPWWRRHPAAAAVAGVAAVASPAAVAAFTPGAAAGMRMIARRAEREAARARARDAQAAQAIATVATRLDTDTRVRTTTAAIRRADDQRIATGVQAELDRVAAERTGPLREPVDGWTVAATRVRYDLGDPDVVRRIPEDALEPLMQDAMVTDDWSIVDDIAAEIDRRQYESWKSVTSSARLRAFTEEETSRISTLVQAGWDPYVATEHITGVTRETQRRAELMAEWTVLSGEGFRDATRRLYRASQRQRALEAEVAVNGHMLTREAEGINARANRRGLPSPIDPYDLFTGNAARARKYASDELKQWWDENGGRLTHPEWVEQQMWGTGPSWKGYYAN